VNVKSVTEKLKITKDKKLIKCTPLLAPFVKEAGNSSTEKENVENVLTDNGFKNLVKLKKLVTLTVVLKITCIFLSPLINVLIVKEN
jgi:hypothetical protein